MVGALRSWNSALWGGGTWLLVLMFLILEKRPCRVGNTELWEGATCLLELMSWMMDGMRQLFLRALEKLSTGFSCCDENKLLLLRWSAARGCPLEPQVQKPTGREQEEAGPSISSSLAVPCRHPLLPKPNRGSDGKAKMWFAKFLLQHHKKDTEGWVWYWEKIA